MRTQNTSRTRKPRILTNTRLYAVCGIARYVSDFAAYNETSKDLALHCVDVLRPDEPRVTPPALKKFKHFRLLRYVVDYPPLGSVTQLSQGDLGILRKEFSGIIAAYGKAIRRVKPDVIVINGSYFLPWCLLQAAQEYGKAPIVMHYHGILKKEIAHWTNPVDKALMHTMEKSFDAKNITYVFPSQLARRIVEKEVFGHKISRATVLANPVAPDFFTGASNKRTGSIGVVSRWTKIKNIDFVVGLAKQNARARKPVAINIVCDLQSAKDRRPFNDIMRFSKPMANRKLARFYGRQGVIVSPSTFETYGNVAQEALAGGTPALVSSQMGVAETFRKVGLSDWIVDFTSPAKTLKKAKLVAAAGVPQEAIVALHAACSSEKIFSQYTRLLWAAK